MQTQDIQESMLSLVSWARTARPVKWDSPFTRAAAVAGERSPAPVEATDDVLFGFSAAALMLTPLALLAVVAFG